MNTMVTSQIDTNTMLRLQSQGIRMKSEGNTANGRKGGAGPSDHKAINLAGQTIMVPTYNHESQDSPFWATEPNELGVSILYDKDDKLGSITFPHQPNFYAKSTSDGVPLWKIATLHSKDVLATTVLQNCIRYNDKETSCQFCAIGESLKADKTIAYKKPFQLAEVAKAAVELDGVSQFVMTTGTPNTKDRGASLLLESVIAVKEAVDIPIQVQCEPPNDFSWFQKLKDAGADSIGMHIEGATQRTRDEIMPGKATVTLDYYDRAFEAAVEVFGKGQVSTYILAGLGDTQDEIIDKSRSLIDLGVYPFVVPFVPIVGTPLENLASPNAAFMEPIMAEVGGLLYEAGMTSETVKAGCAKCGACSTLKSFEKQRELLKTA
ncbi:MSMEG_0568 family radical SAM protein [Reichenbachiella versicolor]|uniref:MSMEG_0568 family radical SAM protein n=1 Tax=Reichenbachiella versicolor TaxID=1821036 RepID=UPI000D6E06CC|nr:MSMEG_0568 family radical SAM protein [Reichenbachiella versicolor]